VCRTVSAGISSLPHVRREFRDSPIASNSPPTVRRGVIIYRACAPLLSVAMTFRQLPVKNVATLSLIARVCLLRRPISIVRSERSNVSPSFRPNNCRRNRPRRNWTARRFYVVPLFQLKGIVSRPSTPCTCTRT